MCTSQTLYSLFALHHLRFFFQDPTVDGVGHRTLWIPFDVNAGPRSEDVVVLGMGKMFGPSDRTCNYMYDPELYPEASDAVHTFAVVQRVMNMYRRAIKRMKYKKIQHLTWSWGTAPIIIFPHAGHKKNAYYDKRRRVMAFFYFRDKANMKSIYTCRSMDVVAHETGHAVLDSLKPAYLLAYRNVETHALHESFADITAIFAVLDHFDMCDTLIAKTKGDLHKKSFLPLIGEEFGQGVGKNFGMEAIRDVDKDLRICDVVEEPHSWSKVFTGAVYDILVRIFEDEMDVNRYDPAETLYRTGKHLISVIILAFLDLPEIEATFKEAANAMIKIEPKPAYKDFMRKEFGRRQIFDDTVRPKIWKPDFSLSTCSCGTIDAAKNEKVRENLIEPLRPAINLFVHGRPFTTLPRQRQKKKEPLYAEV